MRLFHFDIPTNKPLFPILIAFVLLLSAIIITSTFPFGAKLNPNQKVALKFWGYFEPEVVVPVIKDFEALNPKISVEYEKRDPEKYLKILQSRIDNGLGPDIFYFHAKWLPMLLRQTSAVPANFLETKTFAESFFPVAKSDLTVGTKQYGIPVFFEGLALMYNQEMFRSVGLDLPPASWDELRVKYLPTLTVKTKNNEIETGGIALGTSDNVEYATSIVQMMMAQNGVKFWGNGELLINKNFSNDYPKRNLAADALIFYTSFALGQNSFWSSSLPPSVEAFLNGRVAMIFAPSSRINEILSKSQQLGVGLDLRVSSVPQLPDRQPSTWGTVEALGVSASSANKEAAWRFLKYFSSFEAAEKILDNERRFMTVPNIPARTEVAQKLKEDFYLGTYVNQAPSATNFYGIEGTLDEGINDSFNTIFREMIKSAGSGSSETALNAAAAKMEQALIEYGLIAPTIPAR